VRAAAVASNDAKPISRPARTGAKAMMTSDNAVRFLANQAALCRNKDDGEALCLLLPGLLRCLDLPPMNDYEAAAFRDVFKHTLQNDFRFDPQPSGVGCGGPT
jgi:hypothetical protein